MTHKTADFSAILAAANSGRLRPSLVNKLTAAVHDKQWGRVAAFAECLRSIEQHTIPDLQALALSQDYVLNFFAMEAIS